MNHLKQTNQSTGPNLQKYPFLFSYGSSVSETNQIKTEMALTNQDGKLYYVTSFMYFIDLADIDLEFHIRGHY